MAIKRISIKTPAKINLGLKVKGLRSDGYHEIETTMQMVGLFDELIFETMEKGIELITDGEFICPMEENMVYKACTLINNGQRCPGVKIMLVKNIPVSAGLGGGSSDAAATLIGLNKLWELDLRREVLMDLGRRLGSDVPFFLFGPSAVVRGRGDILTPVTPLNAWILLINPPFPVSTSWVYQNYDNLRDLQSENKLLTKGSDSITLPRLRNRGIKFINDLERVTIKKYPVLERIKQYLIDSGAKMSFMSGSGPTVFGIFSEKKSAEDASRRFRGYKVFVVRALTKLPY